MKATKEIKQENTEGLLFISLIFANKFHILRGRDDMWHKPHVYDTEVIFSVYINSVQLN